MTAPLRGGFSVDVENPSPGIRPATIHVHTYGDLKEAFPGAYYWDFETRSFPDMPDQLRRIVYAYPLLEDALAGAYTRLEERWQPWPTA
jgi:hypothetical protein